MITDPEKQGAPSGSAPSQSGPPAYGAHEADEMAPVRNIYACITLNRSDRLRCISFPDATVVQVREAIASHWPRGIQDEKDYYGAREFKLAGYPWSGQGSDAVPSRQLMVGILSSLYHSGWQLVAATDVTKKPYDKDTLFFRLTPIPPPCRFFSISFNEGDKIRLINAPMGVIKSVKEVLGTGIQREEWKVADVAYQFKMHGHPWYAEGGNTVKVRILLLKILNVIAAHGWELHATIDMSLGPGGDGTGGDNDTWFFRKYDNQ